VAPLSLLFSFLGKKIGTILQAIFGWSVTALFGRLEKKKELAVTVALALSIAWPFFVLGLVFPGVAGWALAFLPLERWLGPTVMRLIWAVLAFFVPLGVGALVHFAAPSPRTGKGRALLHGYPLALGFFGAFVVTVVTVPLLKLASILKGWAEEHVYMQPRVGAYDRVVGEICEACARAGMLPRVTEPSPTMQLATKVLKTLARGAVQPIVAEEVRRVEGDGVEMVLYPSDLLLRGKPEKVALVRAMLTRTDVDADAYLVGSERGQCIQDELGRLIAVARQHAERGQELGRTAKTRLVEVWQEMNRAKVPFDEWVMLESIARRVERRIVRMDLGNVMPLDPQEDELDQIRTPSAEQAALVKTPRGDKERTMAIESPVSDPMPTPLEEASTTELVKSAMDEAKELVKLEVELAKNEVKQELKAAQRAAIGFGIAAGASVLVLCLLAMALVLALGGTALVALAVAGAFLVLGGIAAAVGYGMLPKSPLENTRRRLQTDINQLKEHVA
jgi:hypothetical protein